MSNKTPPSLMLVDNSPDERRLIAATASRAGWTVVSAADRETATGLLQGPHGREVRAAILGGWDSNEGPEVIAALRSIAAALPIIVLSEGDSVAIAVEAIRAALRFLPSGGRSRADFDALAATPTAQGLRRARPDVREAGSDAQLERWSAPN